MASPDTNPDTERILEMMRPVMERLGKLLIEGMEEDLGDPYLRDVQDEFFAQGPMDVTGTEFD